MKVSSQLTLRGGRGESQWAQCNPKGSVSGRRTYREEQRGGSTRRTEQLWLCSWRKGREPRMQAPAEGGKGRKRVLPWSF